MAQTGSRVAIDGVRGVLDLRAWHSYLQQMPELRDMLRQCAAGPCEVGRACYQSSHQPATGTIDGDADARDRRGPDNHDCDEGDDHHCEQFRHDQDRGVRSWHSVGPRRAASQRHSILGGLDCARVDLEATQSQPPPPAACDHRPDGVGDGV